jgi:hypothetical protein
VKREQKTSNRGDILFGIVLFFIVIGIAVGSVYVAMPSGQQQALPSFSMTTYSLPAGDPALTICTPGNNTVLRMKVSLRIILLGNTVKIPARIGMSTNCTRPIYTKDVTGTIYIDSPINYPFTLRDFFAVWNEPFSRNQIFSLTASANHPIDMTVNGVPSTDYENHLFRNGEQITITYV